MYVRKYIETLQFSILIKFSVLIVAIAVYSESTSFFPLIVIYFGILRGDVTALLPSLSENPVSATGCVIAKSTFTLYSVPEIGTPAP